MNKLTTIPIIVVLTIAVTACAQTKNTAGNKSRNNTKPTLLQATEQTTMPGRPETPTHTEYQFLIAWKSAEMPLGFFWYNDNTWQPLSLATVKNYTPLVLDKKSVMHKDNFEIANSRPEKISANDTLLLMPDGMGKHAIPEEIKPLNNNTIYYKTPTGKWMNLPIDEITKLPPIVMP